MFDSRPFLIGSADDALYPQLQCLCAGRLAGVTVEQTTCVACVDACNTCVVRAGTTNFTLHPPRNPTRNGPSPDTGPI